MVPWWGWVLIALGVVGVGAVGMNARDVQRYMRIKRM